MKWVNGSPEGLTKPEQPPAYGKLYELSSPWSEVVMEIRSFLDAKLQKGVNGIRFMDE